MDLGWHRLEIKGNKDSRKDNSVGNSIFSSAQWHKFDSQMEAENQLLKLFSDHTMYWVFCCFAHFTLLHIDNNSKLYKIMKENNINSYLVVTSYVDTNWIHEMVFWLPNHYLLKIPLQISSWLRLDFGCGIWKETNFQSMANCGESLIVP